MATGREEDPRPAKRPRVAVSVARLPVDCWSLIVARLPPVSMLKFYCTLQASKNEDVNNLFGHLFSPENAYHMIYVMSPYIDRVAAPTGAMKQLLSGMHPICLIRFYNCILYARKLPPLFGGHRKLFEEATGVTNSSISFSRRNCEAFTNFFGELAALNFNAHTALALTVSPIQEGFFTTKTGYELEMEFQGFMRRVTHSLKAIVDRPELPTSGFFSFVARHPKQERLFENPKWFERIRSYRETFIDNNNPIILTSIRELERHSDVVWWAAVYLFVVTPLDELVAHTIDALYASVFSTHIVDHVHEPFSQRYLDSYWSAIRFRVKAADLMNYLWHLRFHVRKEDPDKMITAALCVFFAKKDRFSRHYFDELHDFMVHSNMVTRRDVYGDNSHLYYLLPSVHEVDKMVSDFREAQESDKIAKGIALLACVASLPEEYVSDGNIQSVVYSVTDYIFQLPTVKLEERWFDRLIQVLSMLRHYDLDTYIQEGDYSLYTPPVDHYPRLTVDYTTKIIRWLTR